ncbi:MAG: stage II sporulation protein D [Oscillospiraceae bacterium]|jgi:stage II sporulation protein D|nr:stage II sporulation protein D [Oscillospiraceae bacterium]
MKKKLIIFALIFLPVFAVSLAILTQSHVKKESSTVVLSNSNEKESPIQSIASQNEVLAENNSLKLLDASNGQILNVTLEEFMCGAIATEMPVLFQTEALKAQGVAIFTNCVRARKNKKMQPNSVDLEVNTKKWLNYTTKEEMKKKWSNSFDEYYEKLREIVNSIKGLTIKSEGEPIVALFSAMSNGQTEKSSDVFGGKLPYLVSTPSPSDMLVEGFQTKKEISSQETKKILKEKFNDIVLPDDKSQWFSVKETTSTGFVKKIKIGSREFSGQEVRNIFELRSSTFTMSFLDDKFTFNVRGHGHGVGMSQQGAQNMAKEGMTYKEIIGHFYPQTTIEKLI